MDGKQLKNSILQWAIQGKLVPQNPKDEPAQKLLERIAAIRHSEQSEESSKRSKKTSKTPTSRIYRENGVWYEQVGNAEPKDISDELTFEIPKNWALCRFNSVCEIARGGSPRPIQDYLTESPNGYNWIKIGDTEKGGKYINSTKERIKPEGLTKTRLIHKGDFLLTNSMSFGRPYISNIDGCIHDGWLVISILGNAFIPDYLYYLLSSQYVYRQFCGRVAGAVVKNLNIDKVAESLIPLPPLAEQKRIVAKLEQVLPLADEYGAAQEQLDKLNKELPEALKKSILQQAIQGKLVPQSPKDEPAQKLLEKIRKEKQDLVKQGVLKKSSLEEIPIDEDGKIFDIPESWAWCNLSMIAETMLGKTKSPQKDKGKPQPYLCSINVYWEGIRLDTVKEMPFSDSEKVKYSVRKGDLLICEGGECGRAAIWEKDDEIFYQNALHRVRFYKGIDAHYFRWCLYLYKNAGWLNEHIKGETIKHLVQNELDSIVFPLPPLAEQKRIVTKLEQLFKVL